ncbi:ankyrin [Hypoxylon sp. EC38]|nr:ankyrin [Hypoxylon sp. EC38]
MHLLDLPLEIFRCILTDVGLDIGIRDLVKMRRVSKVFDIEVMVVLESIRAFDNTHQELQHGIPTVQQNKLHYPGFTDFVGSFLATRPHNQEPWDANISASMNRIADEMMVQDGLAVDDPARSALRLQSSLFRSLFGAAVKSGQADLVVHLLETGLDINDICHDAIEMAIQCDQADMLTLLFSPKYGLLRRGPRIDQCVQFAIKIGHVEAALFLIDISEQPISHWNEKGAFLAACHHGYVEAIEALIDRGLDVLEQAQMHSVVEFTAWYGHRHVLEYLFSKGVNPDPLTLRAAAMNGDVSMAKFLIAAGAQPDPGTWCKVLLLATVHHEFEFTRSILEQVVSAYTLLEDIDEAVKLLVDACLVGDVYTIRALVSAGISTGYRNRAGETPMPIELLAEQQHSVDVPIKMGFSPWDVVEDRHKCPFRNCWILKPWLKRKNLLDKVAEW